MTIGLYRITNLTTGQIYIGSSARIERRLTAHRQALARNTHKNYRLQDAWNTHGVAAFVFEVIETVGTIEEARGREEAILAELIAEQERCYNLCFDAKGALLSIASRAKISRSLLGRKFTPEHRARIGAANARRPYSAEMRAKVGAWRRATPQTPATRAKIGASLAGKRKGPYKTSDRSARRFLNVKTGEQVTLPPYEFRLAYDLDKTTISRMLRGKTRKHRGWILLGDAA